MKIKLPSNVTRTFNKVGFKMKKHSPEILVVAGGVGTVTSAVMACKATTKLDAILDKAKNDIDAIHEAAEHPEKLPEPYTKEDSKKDLTIVYAHTGVELFKLYGPAIAVGALSITSILAGHNILRKRNVALAAAYTAVDIGFKEYRGRVIERFGEELDKELRYNIKAKEVEEVVKNEDGTETIVKKTVKVSDPSKYSIYAKIYDDGCTGWEKDPELNLMFLNAQQCQANDLLKARGHLLLNEVYDMLGIPRTKAGMVVGWVYNEKHPVGDNFVDFGIYDIWDERKRDFVNGYERNIVLDFNVDGNIYELM